MISGVMVSTGAVLNKVGFWAQRRYKIQISSKKAEIKTEAEQNGLWVSGVHLKKLFTFKVSLHSITCYIL